MASKIKLALCAVALVSAFLAGWWVKGLIADRAALERSLATSEAVVAAKEENLEKMQQASQIVAVDQTKADNTVAAMDKEVSAARKVTNESKNINPAAVVVADQLNRLFNSTTDSN